MNFASSLLFLAPQLYGEPGGVQAYMRRLREILTAYGNSQGCQVRCLSLVDACEETESHFHPVQQGTFEGCAKKKVAFVYKASRYALRSHNSTAVVGHIGEVPIAWMLQKLGLIRSYILVLHGIEAWKKVAWLDRQGARGAAFVVATTRYTAREFCKHNNIRSDRMRVIPLATPEAKIEMPHGTKVPNTKLAILTVGRLSVADHYKGIDTLIEAVGKARNNGAKMHLTVVGGGDDLQRLRNLASRLGLDKHVDFLGVVSGKTLQVLYQECDVFAMPSKKEGFGIVFLEAMRYGKPCIGGSHGGIPEVIDHGASGYLVEYGNVEQLTRYLVEFSERPALCQEMGLRGYDKVRARYLFPRMQEDWFALLDESIGKCGR